MRLGLHERAVTGAFSRPPVAARRSDSLPASPAVVAMARGELPMPDLSKVPVTIITGFLGAGKTTLISHLIRNAGGRRLAVVVNEFGTLGVDGDILKSCAIPDCPAENVVELANGCICCTVADDFIPTVEKLLALEPRPDHILIETSGLALPKPLLKAFDWPAIRSRITVDGVLALADAEAVAEGRFAPDLAALEAQRAADPEIDHETPLSEVFEDQLACADMVLLTKADLAGAEGLARAREVISAEAPRPVPVIELSEGVVDPRVILGLGAAAEDDIAARPSHHDGEDDHEHEDFDSAVIELGEIADPAALTARIETLASDHRVLRVKGYVAVAGKPMRMLVQAVGARVRSHYDRPWRPDEARLTSLVAIAEHDHLDPAAIRAVLQG
ncbi:cobalamin biosynthesis protein CobW [Novosphingobium pentaromativorans US6-1]|uniref:Cobalamin biosynthesis protein CobW n=2 Tax=Novosphingobium pentaromativorans TaxID=205844 RepID=G6E8B1_9SPHN|nr:cobalamin biosynthesis protein CobW [Novosphingobium pentaromativorans US6-1]